MLEEIKTRLSNQSIYLKEGTIGNRRTVIGYEKKFRWAWMATQLNTFVVATDYGSENITVNIIEEHLNKSFEFAKINYTGWPRGFQSGLGVISILISENIDEVAKNYCTELKSGKKWAGFTIPVVVDAKPGKAFYFRKNPMWGRIYYPHFKKIIEGVLVR